jgi:hypothetical protein
MKTTRYSARRKRQGAQAMIEFAIILPICMALAMGSLVVYIWQLDIDSAQFAAEEGVQSAALPTQATGPNGLQCAAGARAAQALTTKSFIGNSKLLVSGGNCNPGVPNYTFSCFFGNSYSQMFHLLNIFAGSQTDVYIVCSGCIDVTRGSVKCSGADASTDQIQITVTVAGYKPLPVGVPFIGNRIPYYGQNTQTVQEFQ